MENLGLILLIFGVPIPFFLLCAWVQWLLVSRIKSRTVRLPASLVLPLLTGFLAAFCIYQRNTITGWSRLTWDLLYLPPALGALAGTLYGWLCGRLKREKKDE